MSEFRVTYACSAVVSYPKLPGSTGPSNAATEPNCVVSHKSQGRDNDHHKTPLYLFRERSNMGGGVASGVITIAATAGLVPCPRGATMAYLLSHPLPSTMRFEERGSLSAPRRAAIESLFLLFAGDLVVAQIFTTEWVRLYHPILMWAGLRSICYGGGNNVLKLSCAPSRVPHRQQRLAWFPSRMREIRIRLLPIEKAQESKLVLVQHRDIQSHKCLRRMPIWPVEIMVRIFAKLHRKHRTIYVSRPSYIPVIKSQLVESLGSRTKEESNGNGTASTTNPTRHPEQMSIPDGICRATVRSAIGPSRTVTGHLGKGVLGHVTTFLLQEAHPA
ncbi:hypothetical protein EDB84DRAFT_1610339 [Lactarius hengduanensis]|nr:hypothetical protein EDB84DRAFT_1610339 [Lactarius hengduanensis]